MILAGLVPPKFSLTKKKFYFCASLGTRYILFNRGEIIREKGGYWIGEFNREITSYFNDNFSQSMLSLM